MNKKILIIGSGRHGKDCVAEMLKDNHGVSFISSSYACAEVLKPVLDVINGVKSADDHFNERHEYRELWKQLICLYNSSDKAALAKYIVSKVDVYVGMRSMEEYKECLRQGLFYKVFYVDASERVQYVDPTAEIDYDDTMIKIDNNGTLEELQKKVDHLYRFLLGD